MYSQVARKKPELFKMYQSFKSDEAEKPRNVIAYWAVVGIALFVFAAVGFKMAVAGIQQGGKKKEAKKAPQTKVEKQYAPLDPAMQYRPAVPSGSPAPAAVIVPAASKMPMIEKTEVRPYWERVPVMGRVKAGAIDYVIVAGGQKIFRYKNFDAYTSTAEIPATLAARLPASGGEPVKRETPESIEASGSIAPGKQGAALAAPDARQTSRM